MNEPTSDAIIVETFEKILGIVQDQTKASEDIVEACTLMRLTLEDLQIRMEALEKKVNRHIHRLEAYDENIN